MQDCCDYTRFKEMNIINMKFKSAFSIIELMVVIAIILLLAVIALPIYQSDLTKTKLNSLWQLAEPAKLYVESQYLKNNTNVTTLNVNANTKDVTTANPDLVRCITIQNGVISVVGNPNKFYGNAYWVSWTPTIDAGRIVWSCTYDPTAEEYIGVATSNCTPGTAQFAADSTCN